LQFGDELFNFVIGKIKRVAVLTNDDDANSGAVKPRIQTLSGSWGGRHIDVGPNVSS